MDCEQKAVVLRTGVVNRNGDCFPPDAFKNLGETVQLILVLPDGTKTPVVGVVDRDSAGNVVNITIKNKHTLPPIADKESM